tara:strand:- start:18 stop:422 length:405 start_codon:yes stop_codon:yes gene_type:complete
MNNQYLEEIKTKSVVYYENNYLAPEFSNHTSRESVIDYSGYFYAYAVKLIQNTFQKTRTEAEQSLFRLLSETEKSLTESVKMTAISNYNNLYMMLLDNFKNGIDYGEESMEGFKVMLDSSAKIISISIYWLENN